MQKKIAKYKDLKIVLARERSSIFVLANFFDNSIKMKYVLSDMKKYFGGKVIVRREVARRLAKANKELQKINKDLVLLVAYGYRTMDIQENYFESEMEKIKDKKGDREERIHKVIAVPEISGHPTGGAVDVTIFDSSTKKEIDMGGDVDDWSDGRIKTFCNSINKQQKKNRRVLHDVLVKQVFCPYYGEWWHFSYGDKEWAFFYNKKFALYKQKNIKEIELVR